MGVLGTLLAAILPIIILVGDAEDGTGVPTPAANFTARPIQGATCVAPCAVHFDAIGTGLSETTDSTFTREFHSLRFLWDFGDPNSGQWTTGAQARAGRPSPKNLDEGPIAGHVYEDPGTYTVTLFVANPAGETDSATEVVTVTDPDTHFTDANTFCFATDDLDWNGCPLDCAGGDDNCTVVDGTPTFSQAITSGDNCAGTDDCANADSLKRRILLRRGDSFTTTSLTDLLISDTAPGLVEGFGTGADPHIIGSGGDFRSARGWTATGLTLTQSSGIQQGTDGPVDTRRDNMTWYDTTVNFTSTCFSFNVANGGTKFLEYLAYVEIRCLGSGGSGAYRSWLHTDYLLWMGVVFDANESAGGLSSLRSQHIQYAVFTHNDWINGGSGREHMQLRAFDEMNVSEQGTDAEDDRWNLIADQYMEEPGNGGFFKICTDSGCNCSQTGSCGAPGMGHIVDSRDFLIERNFITCDTRGPTARTSFFLLDGGEHTIRNNVFDVQGCVASGANWALAQVYGEAGVNSSGSAVDGNVHVYNNTIFSDVAYSNNATFVSENTGFGNSGCPTGCQSKNNLIVWPGYTGDTTPNDAAPVTSSNNLLVTTEAPFLVAPPEVGLAQIDDFRIVSTTGASLPRDAGYDFSVGSDTDKWVHKDAGGRCMADGQWDIGAWEYNATMCGQTGDWFFVTTTGNDSTGTGSEDASWLTADKAFETVGPSDFLWIKEGTYPWGINSDASVITGGSSWGTKLTVGGFPGDNVNLRPTSGERVLDLDDAANTYIEFSDLDFDGTFVTSDVVKLTLGSHHIRIRGGSVMNAGDGVGGVDLEQGILVTASSHSNEFLGIEVAFNGEVANLDHGLYIATDNNIIEDCDIHDNAALGIKVVDGEIGTDADNNLVRNNEVYDNGTAGPTGEGIAVSGDSNIVELNNIHNNQHDGVQIYDVNGTDDAIDNIIRFNWIYDNGGVAIFDYPTAVGTITTPNVLVAP